MGSINHGYFVIQVRAARLAGETMLSGVVENLGTGDKSRFQSADGLTAIIRAWGSTTVAAATGDPNETTKGSD
jgi:hypothetical protein